MQRVLLDRSNLPQAAVVALVTVAALAMLAFVVAYWTWAWLAPRPELRTQAAAESDDAPADTLFGNVQREENDAAATGVPIRLLGIVAAAEGRIGYAVVQLETKELLAVPEGEEVSPGIRVAELGIDFVILERAGIRETLTWPEKNTATESPAPRAVQ